MIKYYYRIEEQREFKKEPQFRLKHYAYLIDFWKIKLIKLRENYTGIKNNYAEYKDSFVTGNLQEIQEFKDFCIKDDLECK